MVRNLFIVQTPYQLLTALNICLKMYNDEKYLNDIYHISNNHYEFNNQSLQNNWKIYNIEKRYSVAIYRKLKIENYSHFFFFQENNILNKYLSFYLKKKGTIIALGPDGTKPYAVFNKSHEFLSMIKDTFHDYKFLFKKSLWIPTLLLSKYYKYGSSSIIDEVWLQYPRLFNLAKNKVKAKIVSLPSLDNDAVSLFEQQFIKKESYVYNFENSIIYFNQPIWSENLINKEIEILTYLEKRYNDEELYIKLHPSTPKYNLERLHALSKFKIIDDKFPAEIFINNSTDSIMLTPWSTALMHPLGKNNKFYYLYPEFERVNDERLNQIKLIPFPHLTVLDSIKDI